MENFAKPSVLKNHKNSFFSSVNAIRELIDDLSNNYSTVSDRLSKYSSKQKELVTSLEKKFKTYNLNYKEPLISNDYDQIVKYAEELQSELAISVPSLNEDKKDKVLDDSLQVSSELTQLKLLYSYIEKETNNLLSYEDELSKIRIPEKDSKEETIISFKDINKKKEEDKLDTVLDNVETSIDSSIFNEEDEKESEELASYIDNLLTEEDNNSVEIRMNPGVSFMDRVEVVYGDSSLWKDVYNYNASNKAKIDEKAEILGKSVKEVCKSDNDLNGIIIDFPTELSVENKYEETKRLG